MQIRDDHQSIIGRGALKLQCFPGRSRRLSICRTFIHERAPVLRQLRFGALGDPQDVLTRRRELGKSTPCRFRNLDSGVPMM